MEKLLEDAETIKDKPYRAIYRVSLPESGREVLVKRFRNRSLLEKLRRSLVSSTALREWRRAGDLLKAEVPTPRPLAVGVQRERLLEQASYLLAEALPDSATLRGALDSDPPASLRRRLIRLAAAAVRRMHDAGFQHTDLHANNLLVSVSGGRHELYIVDMQAVRRRNMGFRRRCEDLARLDISVRDARLCATDRLRFLRAYIESATALSRPRERVAASLEQDGRNLRRWCATVQEERRPILRDYYRGRTRRCMINSSRFAVRRDGRGVVHRRREYEVAEIYALIGLHRRCLRGEGGKVLKDTPHTRLTLVADPHDRSRGLCVKEYRPRGAVYALKDLLRRPPAVREWIVARGLSVRGVGAPEAIALLRPRLRHCPGSFFLITRELRHAAGLDRYAACRSAAWSRRRRVSFLAHLAEWMASLYRAEVVHGDMKGSNILVAQGDPGPVFHLVDLAAAGFRRPRRGDVVRALAQLHASVPLSITRADRLRFLRRYLALIGYEPDDRELVRRIVRRSRRKSQVWERM